MAIEVDPAWHESYFGADWLRVGLHFVDSPAETTAETDFIERACSLRPGMQVLDLPCGHGRHAIELAGRGIEVTGVDSMPGSIRLAAEAANARSLSNTARFLVGDMRTFVIDSPADAVIMMQSSFGFMATEDEDRAVLRNLRQSLAPGGNLLLDQVSLFRLAKSMIVPRRWERLDDGTVHIEDREYDYRSGRSRLVKVELFTPGGEHFEMSMSTRIYTLPQLGAMLRSTGFEVIDAFGDYDSRPVSFESKRTIVLAQRAD